MTNIFLAIFAFLYSIAYTVAGPVVAAQDIKFDQSQILPLCRACIYAQETDAYPGI